jgi:hypothetical protein
MLSDNRYCKGGWSPIFFLDGRQQKKDWKKRENKMKALLAAMAEKHALRKE